MAGLVTLFGGGGFLGRYVARELFRAGARVRFASRDPSKAWPLKPQGGLGQSQFVSADIRLADSVARAIAGSDAVINLVGILKGDFQGFHVDGARIVAGQAADAGVGALVQVSAIGADPAAASAYGRSKGEGEAAVRAAFPSATIIRPSILFGPEDNFVNRFAAMARLTPVMPVVRGAVKLQPAYVADAAKAIAAAALDPDRFGGRTYELGGPQVMSLRDLEAFVGEATGRRRPLLDLPDGLAMMMAKLGGWLPGAPMTWDQWLMLQNDNVATGEGFAAFGIAPRPLAAVAPGWLVSYRRQGRFSARPRIG